MVRVSPFFSLPPQIKILGTPVHTLHDRRMHAGTCYWLLSSFWSFLLHVLLFLTFSSVTHIYCIRYICRVVEPG